MRWDYTGCSVTGSSHEQMDVECQDFCDVRTTSLQATCFAVADGAGTARLGGYGADLVVHKVFQWVDGQSTMPAASDQEGWVKLLIDAFGYARDAVYHVARADGLRERDLATTLTLVVAGDGVIAAAQVGDGAVVLDDGEQALQVLLRPSRGRYANETDFLLTGSRPPQVAVRPCRPGTRIALFTDGLQQVALQEGRPYAGFFDPLFRFLDEVKNPGLRQMQLEAFLRAPRVRQRTDDDLTLVLARCEEAP